MQQQRLKTVFCLTSEAGVFVRYTASVPPCSEAGQTQLNSDIVSGNPPDLIDMGNGMNISAYISKGILADLYSLLENDPNLNKEVTTRRLPLPPGIPLKDSPSAFAAGSTCCSI